MRNLSQDVREENFQGPRHTKHRVPTGTAAILLLFSPSLRHRNSAQTSPEGEVQRGLKALAEPPALSLFPRLGLGFRV